LHETQDVLAALGNPSFATPRSNLMGFCFATNPSYKYDTLMADYRRWRVAGGTYFFTVVTHERRSFLIDDFARRALRDAFRVIRLRRPFRIDAIVLLPDHLHTIWTLPPNDHDYATRWQLIKRRFTKTYLSAGREEGCRRHSQVSKGEHSVWQRRYFEHTCRDEADLKRCADYVHVNPLKHGLVTRVRDWPWSSFHRYVRLGEYEPDWGSAGVWHGDEWKNYE
jgi:putative transposase